MIKNLYHLILLKEVWRKKTSPRKSQDTNEPNTFFIVQMKWKVYEIKMINYDDDDDENLAEVGDNDDENDDDDDDDEQRRNKPVDRSCICWSVWRCIWIFLEGFGPVSLVTWVTQFRKLHQLQGWPSAQVCVWVAQFH